ncbi:MAG: serine hydrolase, partial [Lachnospiraceae bacterium]
MRCIDKLIKGILCFSIIIFSLTGCSKETTVVTEYEEASYDKNLFQGELFAESLCVQNDNLELPQYTTDMNLSAAGLFDVKQSKVYYAQNLHEQLYPASTTKVMTAYIALKYGTLTDMVTVSERAVDFTADSQLCGLQAGDQLTLEDLLNGLLLYSGNDTAVAIAEHIGGSVEGFVDIMNSEAKQLGATNSHFVNPHGLHDVDHYTTAYDLYLIFNECLKNESFIKIISEPSYSVNITNPASGVRTQVWKATNYYSSGEASQPSNVKVIGGKTGTTDEAGSCVILLETDASHNNYISIIMGAPDKTILYSDM